jgi:hypothetical protein
VRVRHEFSCRSLILYHKEPPPTHRSIPESIHIALTTYSPRITQAVVGLARWVVDRWPVWANDIYSSGQSWHTVVDSGGGRADDSKTRKWPVLWVSVHDFMLSDARGVGWGFGTCVARCIINHSIYDCDVFRSFFHLYNPYEPSESEKIFIVTDILTQRGRIDTPHATYRRLPNTDRYRVH